jgi:hypothetical protein
MIVPGSLMKGTNDFANAGHPQDTDVAAAYEALYGELMDPVAKNVAALACPDQDASEAARAIVRVVGMPKGTRPFRIHIDPAHDGAETVNRVGGLVRRDFHMRVGLDDFLPPANASA